MGLITLFGSQQAKDSSVAAKIKAAVSRTRRDFSGRIQRLIENKQVIDSTLLEELEEIMISADIGVGTTAEILDGIRRKIKQKTLSDPTKLRDILKKELCEILDLNSPPPARVSDGFPFVILVVGVNGVGKTTTIGKLAHRLSSEGKKVMLCAGDTFRAAANEQLCIWAERTGVSIVTQKSGSDPSAVLFDTLQSAKANKVDYVIVDTAGRLHTKQNLMAELGKMARIAAREVQNAPHETLLVLDATTGQNGLIQAREFSNSTNLTGLIITKMDGTAKGGIATAIVKELQVPIRFIGTGEDLEDLVDFSADDFTNYLLGEDL